MKKTFTIAGLLSILVAFALFVTSFRPEQEMKLSREGAIDVLIEGNETFRETVPTEEISKLQGEQKPFAVVVSCSDSRVPPELIFNRGLGELFVVRTAGNIVGQYEIGSIEYAVTKLHPQIIIVLGHDNCGAIHTYFEHQHDSLPGNVQCLLEYMADEEELQPLISGDEHCIPLLVKGNVLHGVHVLEKDPVIAKEVAARKLTILGGIYRLRDGSVELFDQI